MGSSCVDVNPWGKRVDGELARAPARRDLTAAGTALAEYFLPGERQGWLRRLLGPLAGRLMAPMFTAPVLTELWAEETSDSRAVLPRTRVPVLLIAGDRDRCFSAEVVAETAALVPGCTLIWYRGKGHVGTAAGSRVAGDVLAFVGKT